MTDVPVSLVGGAVRDALLGMTNGEDIDLVVEGDALSLAGRLGRELNVRVVSHGRFGTAYLELPHDRWIDIVMARKETYARPGALPDVEPGTLEDDLRRRDFTINALAYRLTGSDARSLVDPTGGLADLAGGVVRMMRPDSFAEDPSRLVRAARYAARLGFRLDSDTEAAARAAAPDLDPHSSRVGEEFKRLLGEPAAEDGLSLLRSFGVPWLDVPQIPFAAVHATLASPGAPAVAAWAIALGLAVHPSWIDRVAVDGWARGVATEARQGAELVTTLATRTRQSEIDAALRRAKPAAAVVAAARGAEVVGEWWAGIRDRTIAIGGEDLVAAGVRPGPPLGRALAGVRAAVLDGEIDDDRDAQLTFALRLIEAGG